MTENFDPVSLAQALIRCPSVTPADAGALDVLAEPLRAMGFNCHRLHFEEAGTPPVDNLYARLGDGGRHFCFAGHTDVVPVGDLKGWTVDPFAAEIKDGVLFGRGATDMKGAISAFVSAVQSFLADLKGNPLPGSISLLITGDEEGPAINGTRKMLDWLASQGETIDYCLVGEPTNPTKLGEMAKIGRRGSLNATLTVLGAQGHVAYPHLADNPLPRLVRLLNALDQEALDEGTDHFQPSNLEITTIDTGNQATNVIPATASARFNIRFNTCHTGESLTQFLSDRLTAIDPRHQLDIRVSGDAFLTAPGPFTELIADAVAGETGAKPALTTTGGTSDARFIKNVCPVAEFGLISQTMHKIDERVTIADLQALARIYRSVLDGVWAL